MAAQGKKRNTYALFGTFTGESGFRKGEKLRVLYVPEKPKRVECIGAPRAGKQVLVKWVQVNELADLRIVWDGNGQKRERLKEELERILIQAAKS